MPLLTRRRIAATLLGLAMATSATAALAQKKYDTGASDTEIKIGNIVPYSGPASAYGVIGKSEGAYFKKVNAEGGINGRKINFISYDDAYAAEGRRAGAQADRERRGSAAVRPARHPVQHRDPEIRQQQEGAATVRRHRRHQVERPEGVSLDHGLAAELPERDAHLREVSS